MKINKTLILTLITLSFLFEPLLAHKHSIEIAGTKKQSSGLGFRSALSSMTLNDIGYNRITSPCIEYTFYIYDENEDPIQGRFEWDGDAIAGAEISSSPNGVYDNIIVFNALGENMSLIVSFTPDSTGIKETVKIQTLTVVETNFTTMSRVKPLETRGSEEPINAEHKVVLNANISPTNRTKKFIVHKFIAKDGGVLPIDESVESIERSDSITIHSKNKPGKAIVWVVDEALYNAVKSSGDSLYFACPDIREIWINGCDDCTSCLSQVGSFADSHNHHGDFGLQIKGALGDYISVDTDNIARYPSSAFLSRAALKYSGGGAARFDGNGNLTQVLSKHRLLDLKQRVGGEGYVVKVYDDYIVNPDQSYTPVGEWDRKIVVKNNANGDYRNIQIKEEFPNGNVKHKEYRFIDMPAALDSSGETVGGFWTLASGVEPATGVFVKTEYDVWFVYGDDEYSRMRWVSDADNIDYNERYTVVKEFPHGRKTIKDKRGNDRLNITQEFTYYNIENTPGYGKIKSMTSTTGDWTYYFYNSEGKLSHEVKPYLNSSINDINNLNLHRVTEYSYSSVDAADSENHFPESPRTIKRKVLGRVVGLEYVVHGDTFRKNIKAARPNSAVTDPANQVILTSFYQTGEFKNYISSIRHVDKTRSLYTYTKSGDRLTTRIDSGEFKNGAIINGSRSVTVERNDKWVSSKTYDITQSALTLTSSETGTMFDKYDRATIIEYLDGTTKQNVYDCCNLESVIARDGSVTRYYYDELGNHFSTSRNGITRFSNLDVLGRPVKSFVGGRDSYIANDKEYKYDELGRQTFVTDALLNKTSYTYSYDNNKKYIVKTIQADDSEIINISATDGSQLSIGGSRTVPQRYEYGFEHDADLGYQVFFQKTINGNGDQNWIKSYKDLLGRIYKVQYADDSVIKNVYNNKGQLIKNVSLDGIVTLYAYNSRGRQTATAIDMNSNDSIDFGGSDRITQNTQFYTTSSLENAVVAKSAEGTQLFRASSDDKVLRRETRVWNKNNQNVNKLVSWTENSIRKQQSVSFTAGIGKTVSTVVFQGNGNVLSKTVAADGTSSAVLTAYGLQKYNLRKNNQNKVVSRVDYTYDQFDNLQTEKDARNGITTYTYDLINQLVEIKSPKPTPKGKAQITTIDYNKMGRRTKVTQPDGTFVHYRYTDRGELRKTWGSRTYPVEYTYEDGRLKTMKTWKNFSSNSGAALTTWNYTPDRGFLASKVYNDNNGIYYNYTNSGKLQKRTWQRGVSTLYSYHPKTGDLTRIDYSNKTAPVVYAYNRLGQTVTVTDSMGKRQFTYNGNNFLVKEKMLSGIQKGLQLTTVYNTKGQRTKLNYAFGKDRFSTAYQYDAASRLKKVTFNGNSVNYAYHENSNLLKNRVYLRGKAKTMTTTQSYDKLSRLTKVNSVNSGGAVLSSYGYLYNLANQRKRANVNLKGKTGYWLYTYDELGQVKSAKKYNAKNQLIPGFNYSYEFDDIGNRKNTTINGSKAIYQSNLINQYTSITGLKTGPQYDDDGNMIKDGKGWTLVYNGENRLSQQWNGATKLIFSYDYMGRRWRKILQKKVKGKWVKKGETRYVYDGWNLIAEVNATKKLKKTYAWGTDLSGTLQGAGGVGGLLGMSTYKVVNGKGVPDKHYFYTFDGNGNVSTLVNVASKTVLHTYEYGPFGKVKTSDAGGLNLFRFSTKIQDKESGNLYYGLRSLSLNTGRWLNRDPIGEKGGLNLYGLVDNNPITKFDLLGMVCCYKTEKWWKVMGFIDYKKCMKKFVKTKYHAVLELIWKGHFGTSFMEAGWTSPFDVTAPVVTNVATGTALGSIATVAEKTGSKGAGGLTTGAFFAGLWASGSALVGWANVAQAEGICSEMVCTKFKKKIKNPKIWWGNWLWTPCKICPKNTKEWDGKTFGEEFSSNWIE